MLTNVNTFRTTIFKDRNTRSFFREFCKYY